MLKDIKMDEEMMGEEPMMEMMEEKMDGEPMMEANDDGDDAWERY